MEHKSPAILDLFAGPGGWDTGLAALGRRDVVGIEWDSHACATARAAGHRRAQVDIAGVNLSHWARHYEGLIASPPCQGFSAAGLGKGREDAAALMDAARSMKDGSDPRAELHAHMKDDRSVLALEPLRFAVSALLAGKPFRWIAFEQVPAVLPLWEVCAEVLRSLGYDAEAQMVYAEQYGVPQTRKRAILRATLDADGLRPLVPTHSRYHNRTPERLDPGVEKWVSMAEALGWGMTRRPSMTVTGGGAATGGAEPFGNASRQGMRREMEAGRWNFRGHTREPSPAIEGETVDDVQWVHDRPSPTIVGTYHPEVVAAPGYRKAGDPPRQRTPGSVRVTVQEAAILQSFPADYPWQGSKTHQFRQVGDAVPPRLAQAILSTLI